MLQQQPARTERKDDRFLCATFTATCQPYTGVSAALHAGDKLRRSPRLLTTAKTADALAHWGRVNARLAHPSPPITANVTGDYGKNLPRLTLLRRILRLSDTIQTRRIGQASARMWSFSG